MSRSTKRRLTALAATVLAVMTLAAPAVAQQLPEPPPQVETPGDALGGPPADGAPAVEVPPVPEIEVSIDTGEEGLTRTVVLILFLTVGSLLPGLLVLMTSFTRFAIVLSLTRNAIGVPTVPPAPVLIGLSLFLTLFVMQPVLDTVYEEAGRPLLEGELSAEEAFGAAYEPLREFMLAQTDEADLRLFLDITDAPQPEDPDELSAAVVVPAFVLSELRTAFIIGFVIFVPFLIIDLVVSAVLMSLGMVMLPPVFISLPVKLLVFVLVDGWGLIVGSLVSSVQGVT